MSTDLEKAMEEYEAACATLSEELAGLSERLDELVRYQGSLLTTNSLLISWMQNVEELWKHRRQAHLTFDA
ncbi:hypothetical protein Z043_101209 [Scleropages formosus]|uniref:Uncharacterized protein n=1 Tax=Scleropages formosus TaxID=113540 RepID=A0A0P7ZDV3_SCLFO|nr:hypothetical protein Z043_101209 [Scleropages formosus]